MKRGESWQQDLSHRSEVAKLQITCFPRRFLREVLKDYLSKIFALRKRLAEGRQHTIITDLHDSFCIRKHTEKMRELKRC